MKEKNVGSSNYWWRKINAQMIKEISPLDSLVRQHIEDHPFKNPQSINGATATRSDPEKQMLE